MPDGPLHGTKVLDFTIIFAGPYAGLHLSDLGADVIKVERPGGDPFRHTGAVVPENSKVFQYFNRGKRSIVIDLTTARGRATVHRMVRNIDVVITNFRPGTTKRLEIDYESLSAIRPELVYADISGFGDRGPLADRGGGNIIAEAYSGAIAIGDKVDEDGAPIRTGLTVADLATGIAVAMGVSAALYHRERTGEGQLVTASLLRSAMSFTGIANMREPVTDSAVGDKFMEEVEQIRARGGSYEEILAARRHYHDLRGGPYHGGFRARDGAIVLGALTPANLEAARLVLGIEADEPEAATLDETRARMRELRGRVRDTLMTRTVAEWVRDFEAAGVPVSPVNLPEELADDPHASTIMVDVQHELTGAQRQVGPIVEMSKSPPAVAGAAPLLGRHTDEVLREAGFREDEIAVLRAEGVVA